MSTGTGDFKELLYAARDGDLASVKHWVKTDVDLNFLHAEFMFAPLHEAVRHGHLQVARILLQHGANPNLCEGYSDLTPLKIAQANGDEQAIALLEEFGVKVDRSLWGKAVQAVSKYLLKVAGL